MDEITNAKKISKVLIWIYYSPLTSQNSSAIGMSLSGIIFNLTSSLTNDWTPPFTVKSLRFRRCPWEKVFKMIWKLNLSNLSLIQYNILFLLYSHVFCYIPIFFAISPCFLLYPHENLLSFIWSLRLAAPRAENRSILTLLSADKVFSSWDCWSCAWFNATFNFSGSPWVFLRRPLIS